MADDAPAPANPPPPPKGLGGWLARWFMRLQAGTRPCMSWPVEPDQRAEAERAAAEVEK